MSRRKRRLGQRRRGQVSWGQADCHAGLKNSPSLLGWCILRGVKDSRIPRILASVAVVLSVVVAVWWWRQETPALYIAVTSAAVNGEKDENAGEAAAAVTLAVINTFSTLDRVYRLDSKYVAAVGSSDPRQIAQAVAADEVLTFDIDVSYRYDVTVTRYAAAGTTLWTETFSIPSLAPHVVVETLVEHLRRGYKDRRTLLRSFTPTATPEAYEAYLRIKRSRGQPVTEATLAELTAIRTSSPALLPVYSLEVYFASYLFRTTGREEFLDHAKQTLAAGRAIAPGDSRLLFAGAYCSMAERDLEAAQQAIGGLLKVAPRHPSLPECQAELARLEGDPERAIGILQTALEARRSWRLLVNLADLEIQLSRVEAAREHLAEATRVVPKHYEVMAKLGELELRFGDPDRAEDIFLEVVTNLPRPNYVSNLGMAIMLLGDYEEAKQPFEQAVVLGSQVPGLLLNLADVYLILDDSRAVNLYEMAANLLEKSTTPVDRAFRAYCLARLGKSELALPIIKQALNEEPESVDVIYMASLVYVVVQDHDNACKMTRRALEKGYSASWFKLPFFDELSCIEK